MTVINRFADFHDEIKAWRQDIHAHPELSFDVERTAGFVADKLTSFGVDEVVTGIGRTGVVGIIRGNKGDSSKCVGLRADMDALPIQEAVERPYGSRVDGKMHACGHDGHSAMLLGAAKYLAETRNFDGSVAVIFQPAEEDGGGGKVMVDDGMMERFDISEVYGMHNMPDLPVGEFAIRPGPLLASADDLKIHITGRGGHAARPSDCIDPIVIGTEIVQALHTLVSRARDPMHPVVISITQFHAGDTSNVIPQTAFLNGTLRTMDNAVREHLQERITATAVEIATRHGGSAQVEFLQPYPATVNHADQTVIAGDAASLVAGEARVNRNISAKMGAEDFSYMLLARPGAFILIGNGDSAGLHHPEYDFNDEAIPFGCSYWVRLAEMRLAG
ncbi:MAG: M20 family metallopeptidase [Hyphomicrobiales bacterium]|nr:M20 family metallopeptidase [Hyphomicrobiales bacterium]